MKALIFAAGIGSRLKPFTDSHPKALAKVGGITMLQRTVEKIRDLGADKIVVNVHHFANQIIDFLKENHNFGVDIAISDETGQLLDTGGGLLKAQPLLEATHGEPILLHNADILTDAPISRMMEHHLATNAVATLLAGNRCTTRQLYFDAHGYLCGWHNSATGENRPSGFCPALAHGASPHSFNGVHIVDNRIFPYLRHYAAIVGEAFSITPFYVDAIGKMDVNAFIPQTEYLWHDIGTPEKLAAAEREFNGDF